MASINHKLKRKKTLARIVVEAVYCLGFSILGLTAGILVLLYVDADKKLLTPEQYLNVINIIVIGYIIIVIFLTLLIPFLTARKIKKRGQSILNAAERIKSQDLDFEISPSGIKEIDQVLCSMDDMRIALKQSLEKQWRMEHNRKEQISALTHDFKTPLTILKGNLDLLQAAEKDNLSNEYIKDAKGSLEQMEIFFNQLLEMTRAERGYPMHAVKEKFTKLIAEAVAPLVRIADQKEIKILMDYEEMDTLVLVDKLLIERVICNLITNSLDFTPPQGVIRVILKTEEDNALIIVTDSGIGFSKNTLIHGMEQFYMEDTSRGRRNHYGLGLYIVDSIVKQHSGIMKLMNDEETGGAKVIIQIPILIK